MERIIWGGAVLLVLAGCAGSQTQKGAAADLNRAEVEASRKAEEAQREAAREVQEAREKAAREVAAADAAFERERADYRAKMRGRLAELDEEIGGLEDDAWKGTTKVKASTDTALGVVRTKRTVLLRDVRAIDTATAGEWDAIKANLEAEYESLKRAVDDAK